MIWILTVLISAASALTVDQATTSFYLNKKDKKGLCSSDNENELFYGIGLCQTLKETLEQKECKSGGPSPAALMEEIRLRYLGQGAKIKKSKQLVNSDGKDRREESIYISQFCYDPPIWEEAAKDPGRFQQVMMQFFMAAGILESNLNCLNNVQVGNTEDKRGIYNLTNSLMDKEEYACGCEVTNSQSQGGDITGPSPGSRDCHHSLGCGAYIALYEIARDGELFGGTLNDKNLPPKGAAKIFRSLLARHPKDQTRRDPKIEAMEEKLNNYCKSLLGRDGKWRADEGNRPVPSSVR